MNEQIDFSAEYAKMNEDELLALARDYQNLTGSAQSAIRVEFAKRKLEPPLLEATESKAEWRGLVTVKTFLDLSEALVAQSVLESAGIQTTLFDENLVRLYWRAPNMVGGVRLKVCPEDEGAAKELLSQPVPESIRYSDSDKSYQQPRCPTCGSRQIGKLTALDAIHADWNTWECSNCGARWQQSEDDNPLPGC